jgi:hypothetical protein
MNHFAKYCHQLDLDVDIAKRRETLAVEPGVSKPAILPDAVHAWPAKRATHEPDDQVARNLASDTRTLSRAQSATSRGSETS